MSCDHTWFFKPTPGAKELEQVHLDLIGIQSSTKKKSGVNLGWLLLVLTLIALGFGLVMGRTLIQDKWPITTPLYSMVGLESAPKGEGLIFQDLRPMAEAAADGSGEGQRLMLSGVIANTTKDVKDIDELTVTVKGSCESVSWFNRFITQTIKRKGPDQCALESWTYKPSESKIYPGERVAFETSSSRALKGAKSIQVQF